MCCRHHLRHCCRRGRAKTKWEDGKSKWQGSQSLNKGVHLADRLRRRIERSIRLAIFSLGRCGVNGRFRLRGDGTTGGQTLTHVLIRVTFLWQCCLSFNTVRVKCRWCSRVVRGSSQYCNSTVEYHRLWGQGKGSVGGWCRRRRFAKVWGEFGLIIKLLPGCMLEWPQLLLLQPHVKPLGLALLLQLAPLELLPQIWVGGGIQRRSHFLQKNNFYKAFV